MIENEITKIDFAAERRKREDTVSRKITCVVIGIVGGALLGMIIMYFVGAIIADSIGLSLQGEGSFGVMILGTLFGLPLGAIIGLIVAYSKRNSKTWRIIFWISALVVLYDIVARLLNSLFRYLSI